MPRFPHAIILPGVIALAVFSATSAWCQDPGMALLPDSLMAPGTKVVWVKKMAAYCEGPAVDPSGILYFTEQRSSATQEWPIWKINPSDPADTGTVFLRNSSQANGMNFDRQGRLVAAQYHKLTRFETAGASPGAAAGTVLATSGNGAAFDKANDMSIASNGAIYFTDLGSDIFLIDSTGKLKVAYASAQGANGIELIEEQSLVYVNEGYSNQVMRYHIAADGSLYGPELFVKKNGVDGLTLDEHGNFYIASYTEGVITVYNAAGAKLGAITMTAAGSYDTFPGTEANTSNCAFGGPDNKTLFLTGDGGVYSVRLKVAGRKAPGFQTGILRRAGRGSASGSGQIRVAGISGLGKLNVLRSDRIPGNGSGLRIALIGASDRTLHSWPANFDPVTSVLTVTGAPDTRGPGDSPAFAAWVLLRGMDVLASSH